MSYITVVYCLEEFPEIIKCIEMLVFNEMHYLADIQTERAHQSIFQRLVSFDKSEMRHTETEERNVLPSQAGGGA